LTDTRKKMKTEDDENTEEFAAQRKPVLQLRFNGHK
jgi:hypothetical protein